MVASNQVLERCVPALSYATIQVLVLPSICNTFPLPVQAYEYCPPHVQDREALYQAQHKSYCKLSDTFMQQAREASASASINRQRRAQSAKLPMRAVEASRTVTRGASAYRMHTGLHTRLGHTARDTSKDHLIEEVLSAMRSPRDVVFGDRRQGRLHRTGVKQLLLWTGRC